MHDEARRRLFELVLELVGLVGLVVDAAALVGLRTKTVRYQREGATWRISSPVSESNGPTSIACSASSRWVRTASALGWRSGGSLLVSSSLDLSSAGAEILGFCLATVVGGGYPEPWGLPRS